MIQLDRHLSPIRPHHQRPGRTVVETYFASSSAGNYAGVNVASFVPITENAEIVLAGQASSGKNGPSRIEAQFKFRPNARHQLGFTAGGRETRDTLTSKNGTRPLGQMSFQALDQWTVREGVVLVFGADYSGFSARVRMHRSRRGWDFNMTWTEDPFPCGLHGSDR